MGVFDLFSPSSLFLFFISPLRAQTTLDSENLCLLASCQGASSLFVGANSPGSLLANFWAKSPTPAVSLHHQWAREETKRSIRGRAAALWQREWATPDGGKTRLFFPDITSAAVLSDRETCALTSQLLTGHCAFNGHQIASDFPPLWSVSVVWPPKPWSTTYTSVLGTQSRVRNSSHELAGLCCPPLHVAIPQSSLAWKALGHYLKY